MIVARGTGEPQGTGHTGLLAERIQKEIDGSQTVPLDYPASFMDPPYDESVGGGVKAMQTALDNYTAACPDSKVAILAYSQGAQVSMDAICGGSGGGFDDAKPLAMSKVKYNIVAIVLFGDPSHVANTTYDKGTSVRNGIFGRNREAMGVCDKYTDRMVSFCDTGDVYCDMGNDKAVHFLYFEKYADEALKFVVDRFNGDCAGSGNKTEDNGTGGGSGEDSGSGSSTESGTATTGPTGSQSSAAPTATGGGGGGGSGNGNGNGNGSGNGTTSSASLPGRNWLLGALLGTLATAQAL